MRILKILGLLSANLISFISFGQIQTGELPPSFFEQNEKSRPTNYTINLTDPNTATLEAEDAVTDQHNDIAWRFGTLVNVNYNLSNVGEWFHNDYDQTSTWKFKVSYQQAESINLNFNNFKLSPNAKLFIYNDSYSDVLGALTSKNNKEDHQFSIRPIKGNSITLELSVPQNEVSQNSISIDELVYGYRSIHDKVQKAFQGSGSCNINVNCTEGTNWQDVKRAVAMVTTASNTRFCTGTLINNVRQDTTPYFLTAAHCGVRNNSIFIFGYESAFCNPNTDGVFTNSISGSSRKSIAVNLGSDFELRELSSRPPSNYNVYYAGWNNQNVASTKSVCIHHPVGDVKKISIDNDAVTNSAYYASGVTHWQVSNWERGTTQGGSSGSALFNASQQIIGQLHGGDAACGNRLQDYFGKFSHSWDNSPDTLRQLKHWLDPDNTGATTLTGLDPNPAPFSVDLGLIDIGNIDNFQCATSIQTTVRVINIGNLPVDSFYLDYNFNGLTQSLLIGAVTIPQEVSVVNLPSLTPINGSNTLTFTVRPVGVIDQNLSNNIDSISFTVNTIVSDVLNLTFKTDDYGSELSWQLEDFGTGLILHESPGYPNINGGATYTDALCAYSGCFRFSIFDSQGDGFNDPTGRFGNGYALITSPQGDTLFYENNFRTSLSTDTFCVQLSTSIAENVKVKETVSVYPNPIKVGEQLTLSGEQATLSLRNIQGQIIMQQTGNTIQIPESLSSGMYLLEIRSFDTNKLVDIKKVLVQ